MNLIILLHTSALTKYILGVSKYIIYVIKSVFFQIMDYFVKKKIFKQDLFHIKVNLATTNII